MLEILFASLKGIFAAVIVFGYGTVALARGGDDAWLGTVLLAMYLAAFFLGRVWHLLLRGRRFLPGWNPARLPQKPWALYFGAAFMTALYLSRAAVVLKDGLGGMLITIPLVLFLTAFLAGAHVTRALRDRAEAKLEPPHAPAPPIEP